MSPSKQHPQEAALSVLGACFCNVAGKRKVIKCPRACFVLPASIPWHLEKRKLKSILCVCECVHEMQCF